MKIEYKNYVIESDPYCYILRVFWIKKETPKHLQKETYIKSEIEEMVEIETKFYPTVNSCLIAIREKEIKAKQSVVELKEYIEIISKIDNEIKDFIINIINNDNIK